MATRKQKYPDTDTFHYYNANPKNRLTGDCWCRAICTATQIPYNQVVMEMAQMQCETGYDARDLIDRYLASKGWEKHKQPRKENNKEYTGSEFCKKLANIHERYVANIGRHHIVAIVDGKINDTWNSTYKYIGNYWTKK